MHNKKYLDNVINMNKSISFQLTLGALGLFTVNLKHEYFYNDFSNEWNEYHVK